MSLDYKQMERRRVYYLDASCKKMNKYIFITNKTKKQYYPVEDKYMYRLDEIMNTIRGINPEDDFVIEEVGENIWRDCHSHMGSYAYEGNKKVHFVDWYFRECLGD